jgi:hypothetical protein
MGYCKYTNGKFKRKTPQDPDPYKNVTESGTLLTEEAEEHEKATHAT